MACVDLEIDFPEILCGIDLHRFLDDGAHEIDS